MPLLIYFAVDFSQVKSTRTTTQNRFIAPKPVASKPGASKPVASKPGASKPVTSKPVASKPVASKPVNVAPQLQAVGQSTSAQSALPSSLGAPRPAPRPVSQSTASKSVAQMGASRSIITQSRTSVSGRQGPQAPKSGTSKSAQRTTTSKRNYQMTSTAPEEDSDATSGEDFGIGGMIEDDDSREQELAMSSPLKGNELRAAKVGLLYMQDP